MLAAVQQSRGAIHYASEELLLDGTFAPEAKEDYYIVKISLLSGRSAVVLSEGLGNAEGFIRDWCCSRLGITSSGTEALVHGTEVVPAWALVGTWPGLRPRGEVSEYQLIVSAR